MDGILVLDVFINSACDRENMAMTDLVTQIDKVLTTFIMQYDQKIKTGNKRNIEATDRAKQALIALFEDMAKEVAKAYGGCTKCYGKGYSTTWSGLSGARDFDSPGFVTKPKNNMKFCTCERGKQLAALLGKEK